MKSLISIRFISYWSVVLIIFFIGQRSEFYEESVYLHYATSIVNDFDFNLINQHNSDLKNIITAQYALPTHHSVVQTPLILLTNAISWIINIVLPLKASPFYLFSGLLVSLICLVSGYVFVQRAAANLDLKIVKSHLVIYFFGSVLSYFSFFMLTVMEIFTFMLSSFVLCRLTYLLNTKSSNKSPFALGAAAGMLVVTKITFLPLFLATIYFSFRKVETVRSKQLYFLGAVTIFVSAILKDYATFGEIVVFSRVMNEFTVDYSLLNLGISLKTGLFGEGGLFYSNPLYLVGFIGCIHYLIKNIKQFNDHAVLFVLMLVWLGMSFFQTIFIAGPMLEDHYVGRLTLMSLPLLVVGIASLDKFIQFKNHKCYKIIFLSACSILHLYSFVNFMVLYSRGHYEYAKNKTTETFFDLIDYGFIYSSRLIDQFLIDGGHLIIYSFIATLVVFFILKLRKSYFENFSYYLVPAAFLILVLTILNYKNSKENGYDYVVSSDLLRVVTIADHPAMYSFYFVVDILKSQLYNTKNSELREIILSKHRSYLKSILPHAKRATPELRKALMREDVDYGCY